MCAAVAINLYSGAMSSLFIPAVLKFFFYLLIPYSGRALVVAWFVLAHVAKVRRLRVL